VKTAKNRFYLEQNTHLHRYISGNRLFWYQVSRYMLEDKFLIWKFRCGSKDAFRRIYEKYESDLLTLAANLLADAAAAEDVVQDVFISFAESVDNFHLTGSLKAYLATCVANRARDCLRKRKPLQNAGVNEAGQIPSDADEPVRLVIAGEELQRLSHAMARIPYQQREAIVLHLHGNLKFRQIAELQNVPIKTVQSRYRYGLDRLRSLLDSEAET
jgi:RNA polymerase sigma-70 factor (ECF subfamily)